MPVRTVTAGARRIGDLVDGDALSAQHADGATLVLQSVHRMHPPVARFCRALAAELGHATQCNAYITPAGEHQGFDFHHDTHDVFVLQVSGRKRWIVHEPVVRLPLPSQPQAGAHLVPEGAEPLLDVELEAGDALYLPRGYVHAALTTDEHSVHLTVGVLSTTWYDVLTDVVALAGARGGVPRRAARAARPTASPTRCPTCCAGPPPGSSSCRPADVEEVVAPAPGPRGARRAARRCSPPPRRCARSTRRRRCGRGAGSPPTCASRASTVVLDLPGKSVALPAFVGAGACAACSPGRARRPTCGSAGSTRPARSCWPGGCCARAPSCPAEPARRGPAGRRWSRCTGRPVPAAPRGTREEPT